MEIFPSNTDVKTTHGLAFGAVKKNTNIDLSNLTNYRAIDISKEFDITYNQSVSTIKIFDAFCNSSLLEISKDDIEHKTAKKMFAVKNMQDAMDLQAEWTKMAFDNFMSESSKLQDMSLQVGTKAAEPISKQVNAAVEKFSKPITA